MGEESLVSLSPVPAPFLPTVPAVEHSLSTISLENSSDYPHPLCRLQWE